MSWNSVWASPFPVERDRKCSPRVLKSSRPPSRPLCMKKTFCGKTWSLQSWLYVSDFDEIEQNVTMVNMQMIVFLLTNATFLSSALSPVHPAAFPAALAGDPLWRADNEKRSVLQVSLQISLIEPASIKEIPVTFCRVDGSIYRISSNSKVKIEKNPEEGVNEDEDVQMEKARVKEALSCRSCEDVSHCLGSTCQTIGSFHISAAEDSGQTCSPLHTVPRTSRLDHV